MDFNLDKVFIGSEDPPEASSWNSTALSNLDIKMDSNFAWLLCSLLSAMIWVTYITYYHSRVLGYILTRMINRNIFVKNGFIHVGSFTWSVLSGKIMFRDIIYMNNDYTLRIQDGWLIFRWWRAYVPKHVSEDMSHSDTRLSIMLNGFELHVYNRTNLYANLEKTFGLEPHMNVKDDQDNGKEDCETGALTNSNRRGAPNISTSSWRDLLPVIKVDILSGRIVFGNRLVPTTLSVNVEEAHFVYSTKPAASRFDLFMHILKCVAENFKVILAPSPKYIGMIDDPPRYMGEGFVVLSSNEVDLYYYMDEPGIMPEEPEMLQLANGDIVESNPPIWGIDIKCGKGTDFSYGPWADRQREHLFKFFFPNDYQILQPTKSPQPGEKRQVQSFDIRLSTQKDATIDILFSKHKETNAVHVNIEPGSYLEITLPWVIQPDGYKTKVTGQLLHVEASTSLQFRTLLESETLEFNVKCHYPLAWNEHQDWLISFTGCKTTVHLIYAHKEFFQDLINDWATKSQPDLLRFIPYTWKFSLIMKEFEIITLCNNYNWIDCSSQNQENAHIAFCGELFDLSFDLPFIEFLPQNISLRFWIQGESADMSLYIPEVSTSRNILIALDQNSKILDRDGTIKTTRRDNIKKWRRICDRSNGWVDCWSVPIVALSINYVYHPQPPLGPPPQANITTPEKEELLLSPMRIPRCRKKQEIQWTQTKDGTQKFNPMSLTPDKVTVELEIGSSILLVHGSWINSFIHLKENIFGEDQVFTDMQQEKTSSPIIKETLHGCGDDEKIPVFDPRQFRPLDVIVSITMHDVQAHILKNCNDKDPPCPMILLERFGLEMKKQYKETVLQVLLSPCVLLTSDTVARPSKESHVRHGHLMLSGLQVRGHAMFSDEGQPLGEETIEYAWMIEIQLGKLSGKLSTPQLYHLVTSLETLVLLVRDDENNLQSPGRVKPYIQPSDSNVCDPDKKNKCLFTQNIKYRMTRVAVDALDIFLIESGTAIHTWISPIRFSTCNLHGKKVKTGVTGLLPAIQIRQFISSGGGQSSNTNTSGSGRSQVGYGGLRCDDLWLEVGSMSLGPLIIEAALSVTATEQEVHLMQHKFLKIHDEESKRLWFLWSDDDIVEENDKPRDRCGCTGGCAFFGLNRNGRKFFKPSSQDINDGINISAFRINDPGIDPGFGQSILHDSQLVFHTAPYDSCQVVVQDSYFYSKPDLKFHMNVKSQENLASESPFLRRIDPLISSNDPHSVTPTPVGDRKAVHRRFSCTSATSSRNNKNEVPYSRLIEHNTSNIKDMHRDLNLNGSILKVPELELQPRSSASDSKLALDYFNSEKIDVQKKTNPEAYNESHHSLLTSFGFETEKIKQEVQRTVSISSENQSEIFYSADEEVPAGGGGNSDPDYAARLQSSDGNLSLIYTPEWNVSSTGMHSKHVSGVQAEVDRNRISKHENDHEMITSDHKSRNMTSDVVFSSMPHTSASPRNSGCTFGFQKLSECESNENIMAYSDSNSISSTSFISAMSSQEDNGLVNLHMQINRPIVEAPLLMSSYVNHLSQVGCSNWSQCTVPPGCEAPVPGTLFQKNEEGFLFYVGGNYTPKFYYLKEGFSYLKMVSRSNNGQSTPTLTTRATNQPHSGDNRTFSNLKEDEDDISLEEEMLKVPCEMGSRSTILIQFKGDIDVMITPLALESLQRFIDAIIPTFSSLHALTVINHLHFECIRKVKGANILKKKEHLNDLSPTYPSVSKIEEEKNKGSRSVIPSNIYQESISSQTQGVISLPKINFTLLQASVVEELTPFSALDNIRDFACVSIFAICVDKITIKFHLEKQTRETVQTFQRPIVEPSQKKTRILNRGARPLFIGAREPVETVYSDPIHIESSEKEQSQVIIMLGIRKIHAQLRRLPNESSILKDAVITAIPSQASKVMFICTKVLSSQKGVDTYIKMKETAPGTSYDDEFLYDDSKLGFIMFETGLEGVSIKVIKQEQFDRGGKEVTLNEDNSTEKREKTKDEVYRDKPQHTTTHSVIGQTEQFLTAMRFSSKTAASLNNFIEGRALRTKSLGCKTEVSTIKISTDDQKSNTQLNNEGATDQKGTSDSQQEDLNTSSCVIELKAIWFNFAAPPRTPITRKMDYSRLDWNLLSTASPAINAWMNPSSRFALRLVHMFRCLYRRSSGVVSCLMAEALEVPEIHAPVKSRYGRLTPLAKTLQEDPSCQLCNILRKYTLQTDLGAIESNLTEDHLPNLSVLRQGIIVLSRQWKSVLYTPLLLDHNYKTKYIKPLNFKIAMSESDEDDIVPAEGDNSGDENEVIDDCAVLINNEAGSLLNSMKIQENLGVYAGKSETQEVDSNSFTSPQRAIFRTLQGEKKVKQRLPPLNPPSSSRASIVFPIINASYPFSVEHKFTGAEHAIGYTALREDKSVGHHLGSNGSNYSNGVLGSHHSLKSLDGRPTEDLYSWMAKQAEFTKEENTKTELPITQDATLNVPLEDKCNESFSSGYNFYPVHDSLCLLDAHLVFEPLLYSLGVMPQQMISNVGGPSGNHAVFDTWGSSLSLVASMEAMRIDIVVSEYGKPHDRKKGKKGKFTEGKFILELPSELPAFICERIGVEVDVKKLADIAVDDILHKQNVLYISRGQLKKHTSTRLNFSLNIHFISQQVNMPLLRLLHQISSMYQNVKDTQMELREENLKSHLDVPLFKENKNGSSSASDLQEHLSPSMTNHLSKNTLSGLQQSNTQKSTLSPSSSLLVRPQILAQKLRSTTKNVKGYINLADSVMTPILADVEVDKSSKPRCWKTIYYLLDLYAILPETKTISHRFSVAPDLIDGYKSKKLEVRISDTEVEKETQERTLVSSSTPLPSDRPRELSLFAGERTRLVIFGVARIHRTLLLATLSGLKLEAEITNLHSSVTCRKKLRPESIECSLTGQVGRTMIVLLEGVSPNQQTVVKVTVGKSQALYSSVSRRLKDKNSGLLTVGAINIDIPQHPVVLHGMMTRGSKQLSSTLQELGVKRATRLTRGVTVDESDIVGSSSPNHVKVDKDTKVTHVKITPENSLMQPLVMQFSIILQSLSITAALLPSLQAQYTMNQVNSSGVTGSKAKFTIELPKHSLSFTTKLQAVEANLPSAASIDLPKVHVSAEYVQDGKNTAESKFGDGVVLREGSYLSATADIGKFEHSLTTDLLNHLVFVQKVFMKEINEVLQKVYGGEKVVPLWHEERQEPRISSLKRILFSLIIRIKRIQLTATTPTNSAVRLETGAVEFQLSNRVENVYGSAQPNIYMKIFGKAQVDINLSLGQLLKNVIFEEADPEFQQFAFFKTQIGLRNAFQGEMVEGEDKEVVLITLKRPLIYIQPMAVDKAILVWLNYKNAYEYWNEQRSNLNKEVLTATHQVLEKVPFGQLTSSQHLGTLFLQLTVDDMGICLPLNPLPLNSWGMNRSLYCDSESRGAVVVTLESTSISACSSGSLVSKGRFVGLCLRFADDFETSLDDWKPDMNDSTIMNLCVVSEGTYEVCSRTIAQKQGKENAKWFLSVQWQMEGVDIHLDVNVGKQLSALGHTLTMLTGSTEEDETFTFDYDSDEPDGIQASHESISLRRSKNAVEGLPSFVFDPSIDSKRRSKLIEKEMQEQAKIINDLRCLGASYGTIEQEVKRLQDLETMVYKDFRRDMIQRLRRQSVKASSIKGKFGLGKNSASFRSRSFIIPSPTPEHALETDGPDDAAPMSIRSAAVSNSFESSPRSGPSRSASLRVRESGEARVTFSDNNTSGRQSSLPSADSDLSLPAGVTWCDGEHMMIDGEKVRLRKKYFDDSSERMDDLSENSDSTTKHSSPVLNAHSPGMQKSQEPNIDFELDVKVFINSGKCVLHTKDYIREEELKLSHRMKKERSCSGGMFEFPPTSPNASRRNKDSKQTGSSTRLRYAHGNAAQLIDLTIFRIPGLDVKVHYESKIEVDDGLSPGIMNDYNFSPPALRKSGNKKASLFAWTILQSIPEETIISPHILEFLEKTLEQVPSALVENKESFSSAGPTMFTMNGDTGWGSSTVTGNYAYASFPVDVMVYFHMEPSTFRFSCLPVSRVECMLQLPSLDIVFSSKRAEEELQNEFGSGSSFYEIGPLPSAVGGLSVTGCLSDFSVHIFHPYGGGKKTGVKEAQWSPLADTERKDSLSINVEFVKFHLSRSRKINFQSEHQCKFSKGLNLDKSRAVIRFSTIVDIGSASFKYDMRRLTEILAFPKAWYRRSIVRRLFLGELNITTMHEDGYESSHSGTDEEIVLLHRSDSGRHLIDSLYTSRGGASNKSPMMGVRDRDRLKLNLSEHRMRFFESNKMNTVEEDGPTPADLSTRPSWETLVLFAVNFTKLRVQMNMGNVMGNVMWLTKDFHSEGRLSIGSTGHKNMYIGLGLGTCNLDAKGGIVGGTIDLSNIDTFVHIREDPGTEPDHTVGLRLYALELRLDYMGTGVLMSRVSSLNVSLRDEWRIHSFKNTDSYIPTRRPAMIFMHGDLGWDQLQIMMSKSTTADLLKMYYKLDEFFSQQFQSSKRVFSSLQPKSLLRSGSTKKKALRKKTSSVDSGSTSSQFNPQDQKHHRHWQNVLTIVGGLNLYTFKVPLPLNGTVLGGTMELHGSNISLACFHGINFKSKSWALFSLKEPCISFATEAQEIPSVDVPNKLDVHIVETLTFSLGMTTEQPHAQHHSMATICRMSRNVLFPPQYKTLQEWFSYAFAGSDIDAVDRFPTIERDRSESVSGEEQKKNTRGSIKLQDFNHSREDIFALPSMQLHLKTEHLQGATTPEASSAKPVVECSFITEFEDHIFVTFDAEAFFFLHDLISSYLKEREKVSVSVAGGMKAHSPELERRKDQNISDEEKKSKKSFDGEMFSKDWRTYHCKTWHLEPTVRLWSWAGKSIEPYGIDFILQKLGFSHARTTIPKWMQRGFMDPLDKVLAMLMLHMVSMVREGSSELHKKPS